MFNNELKEINVKGALVHCITNYVTVNDCANAILAVKGSPIMADDENEVSDITSICNALVINIGTLNKRTIESMIIAGKKANELNHPVILDPVGAGASAMRTNTAKRLLEEIKFSVIRGNISEIKALAANFASTKGVDANDADLVTSDNVTETIKFAQAFSQKTGAVIAITGAIDIIANESQAYTCHNGCAMMSRITGTGCMLSAILGAFCGSNQDALLQATLYAITLMGYCGEVAAAKVLEQKAGTGTFRVALIDALSTTSFDALKEGAKVEVF